MTFLNNIFIIAIHSLVAWILVEMFVNNAHRLSRAVYIFFHHLFVATTFVVVFFIYFKFFATVSVFSATAIAMTVVSILEFVVFGYLYSGDRWFLNYIDWILPMFIAMSAIYLTGIVVK